MTLKKIVVVIVVVCVVIVAVVLFSHCSCFCSCCRCSCLYHSYGVVVFVAVVFAVLIYYSSNIYFLFPLITRENFLNKGFNT